MFFFFPLSLSLLPSLAPTGNESLHQGVDGGHELAAARLIKPSLANLTSLRVSYIYTTQESVHPRTSLLYFKSKSNVYRVDWSLSK